jgi:hypothetical protein
MEIIINQTACAIELLAKQWTQMRAAMYHNHLGIIFSWGGGSMWQVHWSYCCLHIDDNSQAVLETATNIGKMAHVPVQVWKDGTQTVCDSLPWADSKPW